MEASSAGSEPLKPEFVYELIALERPRPLGANDSLSGYLFRRMTETKSGAPMIDLVDAVAGFINTSEVDNEFNQLKIQRMLALVADMPEAIPEHERLRVWEYVIDTDWIHGYENPGEIGRWVGVMQGRGSMLADHLPTIIGRIFLRKSVAFDAQFGFGEATPRVSRRNFDFEAACHGVLNAAAVSAEASQLYQSIVSLAMLSREVIPDEVAGNL